MTKEKIDSRHKGLWQDDEYDEDCFVATLLAMTKGEK